MGKFQNERKIEVVDMWKKPVVRNANVAPLEKIGHNGSKCGAMRMKFAQKVQISTQMWRWRPVVTSHRPFWGH